jgi:hypothetical protein
MAVRRPPQVNGRDPGRPRSTPRPMPEMPVHGYAPYRAWGRLPAESGRLVRLLGWLLGPDHHLLYLGITSRAGFVRWVEESDTWTWARDVSTVQRDDRILWPTLYDAVLDDDGRLVLALDATQPEGVRPARPKELVDPQPFPWQLRGEDVIAYRPHPAGRPVRGDVIEGARTGERRLIHAEAPVHNIEHNEGNPGAVNRRRRILPRHVAAWRRQAANLALAWAALAAVFTWALYDSGGIGAGLADLADGVAGSAVLVLLAQLGRQATRGRAKVALQKRRNRRTRRRGRR